MNNMVPEFPTRFTPSDAVAANERVAGVVDGFATAPPETVEVTPLVADSSSALVHAPSQEPVSAEITERDEPAQEESAEESPEVTLTPAQEVHALFAAPEIGIAAARGELRLAEGMVHDQPLYYTESPQFRECEAAYAEVAKDYHAALGRLLDVMDDRSPRSAKFDKTLHTSWHYQEPVGLDGHPLKTPGGQPVRLAHEVIAIVSDEDGRLQQEYASSRRAALIVRTHVIHTPRHGLAGNERALTGTMALDVVNDADVMERNFKDNEVVLTPIDHIAAALMQDLIYDARQRAVVPWVEDFLQLPLLAKLPELFTSGYDENAITKLITCPPSDAAVAQSMLSAAFGHDRANRLRDALSMPLDVVCYRLQEHGALPRYSWLMQHASALQMAVQSTEREALTLGFRVPFVERLAVEEAKVTRIRTLAETLGTMVNINANAPERSVS